MVAVVPKPFIVANVNMTLDAVDYSPSVNQVQFDPTTPKATFKGLAPGAVFVMAGEPSWVATIGLAQDWETATGLAVYLMDNVGEIVPATFEPKAGGTPFTCNLLIEPGPVGGTGDNVAVATVALSVVGPLTRGTIEP